MTFSSYKQWVSFTARLKNPIAILHISVVSFDIDSLESADSQRNK